MDYTALLNEISLPEYSGANNATIVATLRTKTVAETIPIPFPRIAKDLVEYGVYSMAKFYVQDPNNAANTQLRVVCDTVVCSIDRNLYSDLDPNDVEQGPKIKAILDGLQAAGVLAQKTRDLVIARGTIQVPILVKINCPELSGMDDWSITSHVLLAQGKDPQASN